jgi:hypothetical protein
MNRLCTLGLAVLAAACGPSFHAIYEGNARFEHCYALEENPQTGMREKADCWRDWSERYTYGQTRDRIQYATARYVALSQAPNIPTDEALMMAAPGMTPRVQTITAPAPTSALAPPPKTLDYADAGAVLPPPRPSDLMNTVVGIPDAGGAAPSATVAQPPPPPPWSDCMGDCARAHIRCKSQCGADPGGCEEACRKISRTCLGACVK